MTTRSNIVTTTIAASLLVLLASALLFIDFPASTIWDTSILSLQNTNSTSIINRHHSDHDSLIPLQRSDIVGFLFASFGLVIAAGGGIGGGGILVPIYILIFGFKPKHAIPLSNVSVLGGAISNTMRNSKKRHPNADRPLIDWDVVVVMEPPTLAGALIGANLNKILPEVVIAVMLVVLLVVTSYGTLKKAHSMYQKETEEIKRQNVGTRTVAIESASMPDKTNEHSYFLLNQECLEDENESSSTSQGLSLSGIDNSHNPPSSRQCVSSLSSIQLDDEGSHEDLPDFGDFGNSSIIEEILEEEKHPKRRNVFLIVTMFVVVLLINILKGGGGFQSPIGIACGSTAFWTAQALLLVWILFISLIGQRFLLKDAARKAKAGYVYMDEDLKWDAKSTIIYPLVSSLAGFCAGMFGIGGGIIKGPLMLAMGIHPAVASATSACMILFTSFTATTIFSVYGLMVPDYAIVGAIVGFCATFVGQTVMSHILTKSKRNSYIAFSIGFVVLLSAMLMTLESVLNLVSQEENEEFGGICASHLNGHNT